MIEDYAAAMAETIRQHSEGGAVLLPNTRRGKLLAAKLGYRLSAAVSNDASEVALQDGKAAVKHMVYGGLAIGAESIASPFAVITVSAAERLTHKTRTLLAAARCTPCSGRLRPLP